jgi:predicted RNA-binding protein with PUA-like domain
MPKSHWLVKSDPDTYGWAEIEKDGTTRWDGVRNFQARNHLRAMKSGERVLFYHSGEERAVVGIAEVVKEAYPDPTEASGEFSAVDLRAVKALPRPVSLGDIKKSAPLKNMLLLRQSRLSVMPVTKDEFDTIVKMGSA